VCIARAILRQEHINSNIDNKSSRPTAVGDNSVWKRAKRPVKWGRNKHNTENQNKKKKKTI
jgi:hypothetical protein